jgi:tetratricopeptide (TPR) repeat protein
MDELRIIKYLDGEMPGEELRAFEEEIRMNPPLAEEVRKYRQIQDLAGKLLGKGEREPEAGLQGEDPDPEMRENALDPAIEQEISEAVGEFKKDPSSCGQVPGEYRETLAQAGKAFFENRGKTGAIRMIRRIWYTAAAVVVLAVTVSILILKPFEKIPAGEVYAQYFRTFHKTDQITELARTDNDFLFATQVYEAGDFERAAVLFEMLADSSEVRAWSLFYAGSSYMSLNQPEKAAGLFTAVIEEGDQEVISPARWQLALCYLRMGRTGEARKLLEMLREDPVYRKDAGKILRILR